MTPRRVALAAAAVATAAAVHFGFRPSEALPPARGGTMSGTIQVWSVEAGNLVTVDRVARSDEEWRDRLTPEQFRVAREHGTERAFSGATWDNHARGLYRCVACGNDLFSSEAKYDSGTGWPSFWQPVHPANVGTTVDSSLFMHRIEVHCARCGSHLGHVFEDGPRPTGLRYCMNSAAMAFVPVK